MPVCLNNVPTLCWECKNAVPNEMDGTGCSWSKEFKPVKGWDAKKTAIHINEQCGTKYKGGEIPSFLVRQCPCFVQG